MYIFLSEIIIVIVILLLILKRLRVKKIKTYYSSIYGEVSIWEKYNKEKLLNTNGFSQGISIGDRSIENSYWYFQAEKIIKKCKNISKPKILWLGLGAGTGPHLVYNKNEKIQQLAIEIDPTIVKADKEYFEIDKIKSLKLLIADAYVEINNLKSKNKKFDVIIVDIYLNDDPINGNNLMENNFLNSVIKLLNSDSIVIFNRLAHKEIEREGTKLLIKLLESKFKSINITFIKDTRGYRNEIVIASSKL